MQCMQVTVVVRPVDEDRTLETRLDYQSSEENKSNLWGLRDLRSCPFPQKENGTTH